MIEGLLWYDGDPKRSLEEKIGDAAQRYHEKYGILPTVCYINDANGPAQTMDIHGHAVKILTAPNILLHHYWIGEHDNIQDPYQREREPGREGQDPIGEGV